jgi:hypothetical protein
LSTFATQDLSFYQDQVFKTFAEKNFIARGSTASNHCRGLQDGELFGVRED